MRIGLVGIGNMGFGMAARLLDQGWAVAVRDLDARREGEAAALGASVRPTPAALAAASDCLIVAVVDAAQTETVLFGADGAAAALRPGGAVMLCPTIAPEDVERFAARLAAAGIDTLDAPMSGGPARARDGSMSLMLACGDAVFERHQALLQALSSRLFRVGERLGLDLARTLDIVEQSSGQSWIGTDRMRRAIAGDLAPRAHTTLLAKDTRLALQMAAAAGLSPALGALAAGRFAAACADGFDLLDDASLLEHLRRHEA